MPKKTKKQKILARLHRKIALSASIQSGDLSSNSDLVKSQNNLSIQNQAPTYLISSKYTKEIVPKAKNEQASSGYAYIRHDLIRITIFTAFALATQGVLYFLIRTK